MYVRSYPTRCEMGMDVASHWQEHDFAELTSPQPCLQTTRKHPTPTQINITNPSPQVSRRVVALQKFNLSISAYIVLFLSTLIPIEQRKRTPTPFHPNQSSPVPITHPAFTPSRRANPNARKRQTQNSTADHLLAPSISKIRPSISPSMQMLPSNH